MVLQATVRDTVLSEISRASGVPERDLTDSMKLRSDLEISHPNFVTLAQKLRSFIKDRNPDQTLVLTEIDTPTATVGGVVALVASRIDA